MVGVLWIGSMLEAPVSVLGSQIDTDVPLVGKLLAVADPEATAKVGNGFDRVAGAISIGGPGKKIRVDWFPIFMHPQIPIVSRTVPVPVGTVAGWFPVRTGATEVAQSFHGGAGDAFKATAFPTVPVLPIGMQITVVGATVLQGIDVALQQFLNPAER